MRTMKEQGFSIIQTLNANGYEAFFIGGSVRNGLHNLYHHDDIAVKDFDIVTSASYEQVAALFDDVDTRGEQFKVAVVKIKGNEFEVAQYRGETYPEGGSLRPNEVHAVQTLEEDVKRRDFTINGIAEDVNGGIIDYVDGIQDIKDGIIRAIGVAQQRFSEDPLRILRAYRFVAQLGYDVDRDTENAMITESPRLSIIPHERVATEMEKILKGKYVSKAIKLMYEHCIEQITFYNSIEKKQVKLLDAVLKELNFKVVLKRLDNLKVKNITSLYTALYSDVDWKVAEQEMKDSMFMNMDDIHLVTLVLKHKRFLEVKTDVKLLELIKDLNGKFSNRSTLLEVYSIMKDVFGSEVEEFDELTKRKLFKQELDFTGEDVLAHGKKLGYDKPGKWVSEVINSARDHEVLGQTYELESLVTKQFTS